MGQKVGQLIGHLLVVAGACLCVWAVGRFLIVGNAPSDAVETVMGFIYSASLEGIGKLLLWFSGWEATNG